MSNNNTRQLSRSIHLKVTNQGEIKISCQINHFVTEEEQKAKVNGEEVKL